MLQWSRLDWIYEYMWSGLWGAPFHHPWYCCCTQLLWTVVLLCDWKSTFFKQCRYYHTYVSSDSDLVSSVYFCFYPRQSLLHLCFISFLICLFAHSCSCQSKGVMGVNAAQHEFTKLIKPNIQNSKYWKRMLGSWDWSEEKGKQFDFCSLISVRAGSWDVRCVVVVGKGVVHCLWLWGFPLCHTHFSFYLPILWP